MGPSSQKPWQPVSTTATVSERPRSASALSMALRRATRPDAWQAVPAQTRISVFLSSAR